MTWKETIGRLLAWTWVWFMMGLWGMTLTGCASSPTLPGQEQFEVIPWQFGPDFYRKLQRFYEPLPPEEWVEQWPDPELILRKESLPIVGVLVQLSVMNSVVHGDQRQLVGD